jgi:hypothetical protein
MKRMLGAIFSIALLIALSGIAAACWCCENPANEYTVNSGQHITLNAGGGNGYTYKWVVYGYPNCDVITVYNGNTQATDNAQAFTFDVPSYTAATSIIVKLTVTNGAAGTKTCTDSMCIKLNVNKLPPCSPQTYAECENQWPQSVSTYPNTICLPAGTGTGVAVKWSEGTTLKQTGGTCYATGMKTKPVGAYTFKAEIYTTAAYTTKIQTCTWSITKLVAPIASISAPTTVTTMGGADTFEESYGTPETDS